MRHKILIVDDEAANLRLLERLFSTDYFVMTAESGGEALELVRNHEFALIISDQRMPAMTGIEFLKRASAISPLTVRIILTGYTDAEALVEAINSGAVYKYVTKPWINSDLQQTVRRGLQHFETVQAQQQLQENSLVLRHDLDEVRSSMNRFAANSLNMFDAAGCGRAIRLSRYATETGKLLGLSCEEIDELNLAIFLQGLLLVNVSENSTDIVNRFERGMRLMKKVPYFYGILPTIKSVSEHFDGSGGPDGLKGQDIPVGARIIAVVTAYDEMVSTQDRGLAVSHAEAVRSLGLEAGGIYDPKVVEAFCNFNIARLGWNSFLTADLPRDHTMQLAVAEI